MNSRLHGPAWLERSNRWSTEASDQALRYAVDPGTRRPLHALAAGKVILSALSEDDLARYFAETTRAAFTPATRHSEADLRSDIAEARNDGLAVAREEATVGIVGNAVPVLLDGRFVGVFSVAVPAVRFDAALEARVRQALLHAAAALAYETPTSSSPP